VLSQHGLRLNVDIASGVVGADKDYPFIKASSWVRALDNHGKLEQLFGLGPEVTTLEKCGPVFLDFWDKYRKLNGNHSVFRFADEGSIPLNAALPVVLHGDEGTTYKKDGCLVFSFHNVVGRGTISNKLGSVLNDLNDGNSVDPHTNFVGHAFQTRFLLGTLLKESWYHIRSNVFMIFGDIWGGLPSVRFDMCLHRSVEYSLLILICLRKTTGMTTLHTLTS
jgi:hypothetical protein